MATVTLTAADDGGTVEARVGDEVVLRLAENPTTGFRWHVERADGPIEALDGDFEPAAGALVGGGGTRMLRFRARGPGEAALALKLWQEWEGDASVTERFAVRLTIQA